MELIFDTAKQTAIIFIHVENVKLLSVDGKIYSY